VNSVEHFSTLARYNQWMNGKIYNVCGTMSDAERKRDLGAYFGSIHGTMNHILYGDRAWMSRFQDKPAEMPVLGKDLFDDFSELADRRAEMDGRILEWTLSLDEDWLGRPFGFKSRWGDTNEAGMASGYTHVQSSNSSSRSSHDVDVAAGL
jgi:uncharacterized damage-inducible protein DinB